MTSRRRALLGGLLASLAAGCAQMPAVRGQRVLVIGAGFAGLSAARALRQSGMDVVVLEARSRPGGRVLTDRSLGFPIDLGPSWLHGGPRNPLKTLAEGSGIATQVSNYANFRFTNASSGRRLQVAPTELLETAQRFSDAMSSVFLWGTLYASSAATRGLSVADVFEAAIRRIEAKDGPIDRGVIALQRWVLESNLAAPLEDVGAAALLDDSDTGAGNEVLPPDDRLVTAGMDSLISLLALDLDIRYDQVVQAINWRPGTVAVSAAGTQWRADAIVVTLPIGVLAEGSVRFDPPLPASIAEPMSRLRMGLLNKICLSFPHAFWDERADFLTFYNEPAPLYYAWLNLMRYGGRPALIGFTSGRMARTVETMSDEALVARVMRRMRVARGARVPEPVAVRVSHWASDPYARGSYSYPGVGASGGDRTKLQMPLDKTLFFAGEATHRDDPASVHGAWWSGLRAARQILGDA